MEQQTKSLASIFFVFAGYVLSVTAFVLGGTVGSQLTFQQGILCLLVGDMILGLYAGLIGYVGFRTQKSSADLFKPVFGRKGQVIAATVVSLFSLIFVSVYSSLVGSMMSSLFNLNNPFIGLFLYLILITFINLKGFKGMSVISNLGVPAIGIFVIYGMIVIAQKIGFSNVTTAVPSTPASFFAVLSTVVASWTTGATFSSDITRYVKKGRLVFFVTFGSFLCVTVLESVGLICALGTGESNIVTILGQLHMSGVAFIIYLLLTITSGQAVVFIAAQALANVANVIKKEEAPEKAITANSFIVPISVFAAIVAVFMTINGFTNSFLSALSLIGIFIPPVGGAIVSHYFFVEREYVKTFENMPEYRPIAFVPWIVGVLVSKFLPMGIHPLNGFITAIILYFVLRKVTDKKDAA